jgi:hypothetical protein
MSEWRTSSYTGEENCVEVALAAVTHIRDTKNRSGGTLEISTRSWATFLDRLTVSPNRAT